jgi:hypothetical protein
MKRPVMLIARIWLILGGLSVVMVSAMAGRQEIPNDTGTVVHVLNRLGFGPAPGDVERVQRMGVGAYVEQQLNPPGRAARSAARDL